MAAEKRGGAAGRLCKDEAAFAWGGGNAAEVAKMLIDNGAEVNAKTDGRRDAFALGGVLEKRGGDCETAD